jgi:hypothetical protein
MSKDPFCSTHPPPAECSEKPILAILLKVVGLQQREPARLDANSSIPTSGED